MNTNKQILYSIIIPVLNEEFTIVETLRNLFNIIKNDEKIEVIIVDNGSTDQTLKKSRKFPVRIIYEKKKGYGRALQAGIYHSKGDFIAIFDGDNTYDLSKLPFMLKLSLKYDLIIGNRLKFKKNHSSFSSVNLIGNKLLSLFVRIFFKLPIQDTQSGFRVFKKKRFFNLSNATGMEYALDILLRASKSQYSIIEIPINYYLRHKESKSKLEIRKDSLKIFKQFLLNFFPINN
ncbi:MAG: Glycosyltransferase AglJ [Candidatus Heimdallarchaeota archaeon LC_3]|nr:MAG: Glycosyltransferase AglJ [Candidatus Heimdallarchaeota archaeon LC_3]